MANLLFNPALDDDARRKDVFAGAIILYSATAESLELVRYARQLVIEAFGDLDPEHAQESLQVSTFIDIAGPLKSRFTNAPETKRLLVAYLEAAGVDLDKTFFDVPRLRIVPHSGYLTAGVSYAYKAHRDIWYSSPTAQMNWWAPVWGVTPDNAMAFFPDQFDRPLLNSSRDFDYGEWTTIGRAAATSQTSVDTRKHPLPQEEITASELRYGAAEGDMLLFSASQLHATVPNESKATRFSIDFRTVHIDDLRAARGGPNVDSAATGSTLGDFLRAADLEPLARELTA